MAGLVLKNLTRRFGKTEAVSHVDVEVAPGEFCVLVGPSGCGKSTLLRMIAGLEAIDEGELTIDGARMNDVRPAERGVSMVFQSYALYPHMTVYRNMAFGLKLARTATETIEERVRAAARTLQIEDLLDRRPAELSGGERQRVAIGRAIVRQPKVFLFDEPLSNLDAALRVQMRMEIAQLHERLGTTIVYVTHDQVEAMTLADKVVVLNQGRVEQIGAPLDLYRRPANLFVAGFIGSPKINLLDATVTGRQDGSVTLAVGEATLSLPFAGEVAADDRVTLGIRPEQVTVNSDGDGLVFTVAFTEELGESRLLHGTLGSDGLPFSIRLPHDSRTVARGDRLGIEVQKDLVLLFDGSGKRL
jgi:ABC-type sugar transport system ATPase subunit